MMWRLLPLLVHAAMLVGEMSAQTTATVTRGPYLQLSTPTSLIVRWRANPNVAGRLWYGLSPIALNAFVDATLGGLSGLEQSVQLTGLTPDTRYYYAIGLTNGTMLVGGDASHTFKTPPVVGDRSPFRAWVLGDSGTGSPFAAAVRDAYKGFAGVDREADMLLMLGDNAYPDGTDTEYQTALFDMYPEVLRKTPMWSTFGNHDAHSAVGTLQLGVYFELFDFPTNAEAGGLASGTEAYYSFDRGNVHFVCLNSQDEDRSPTGPMATWLQADLSSTNQDWVIAYWHHPPYTKGTHDSDIENQLIEMRQNILPILESLGVDLVLCGHSHVYERSVLLDGHYGDSTTFDPMTMAVDDGTGQILDTGAYKKPTIGPAPNEGAVYIVNGASGAIGGGPMNHPVMVSATPELGSVILDVNGLQLDVRYLDRFGLIRDHLTMAKGAVTPLRTHGTLIPAGSDWRYEDTGTDLGTAWRDPLFVDTGWPIGSGALGFGEPYLATSVSFGGDPNNVHPTTYFRHTFNNGVDPTAMTHLRLSVGYDDAFVAYLNGVEIARRNLPGGVITYSTLALQSTETIAYEACDASTGLAVMQVGLNVLAIEVHQDAANSDDLVLDVALTWEGLQTHHDPACSAGQLGDVFTINGTSGGYGRSMDVSTGLPLVPALSVPASMGVNADFVIFGRLGDPATAVPFPFGVGNVLCMTPSVVTPGDPALFILASSLQLPNPFYPGAAPAPWAAPIAASVPIPGLEIVLQPVLTPVGTSAWQAGNAIRLLTIP